MQRTMIYITFTVVAIFFGLNSNADINQGVKDQPGHFLPYGVYQGTESNGNNCTIDVTTISNRQTIVYVLDSTKRGYGCAVDALDSTLTKIQNQEGYWIYSGNLNRPQGCTILSKWTVGSDYPKSVIILNINGQSVECIRK